MEKRFVSFSFTFAFDAAQAIECNQIGTELNVVCKQSRMQLRSGIFIENLAMLWSITLCS